MVGFAKTDLAIEILDRVYRVLEEHQPGLDLALRLLLCEPMPVYKVDVGPEQPEAEPAIRESYEETYRIGGFGPEKRANGWDSESHKQLIRPIPLIPRDEPPGEDKPAGLTAGPVMVVEDGPCYRDDKESVPESDEIQHGHIEAMARVQFKVDPEAIKVPVAKWIQLVQSYAGGLRSVELMRACALSGSQISPVLRLMKDYTYRYAQLARPEAKECFLETLRRNLIAAGVVPA